MLKLRYNTLKQYSSRVDPLVNDDDDDGDLNSVVDRPIGDHKVEYNALPPSKSAFYQWHSCYTC